MWKFRGGVRWAEIFHETLTSSSMNQSFEMKHFFQNGSGNSRGVGWLFLWSKNGNSGEDGGLT